MLQALFIATEPEGIPPTFFVFKNNAFLKRSVKGHFQILFGSLFTPQTIMRQEISKDKEKVAVLQDLVRACPVPVRCLFADARAESAAIAACKGLQAPQGHSRGRLARREGA